MQQNTITAKKHSEIALAIKAAKKQMFKRHREGMDLREAADKFCVDICTRFEDIVSRDSEPYESVEATLPGGEKVDLVGDAVDIARADTEGKMCNLEITISTEEPLTIPQLEAIADRFVLDYEYDEERITPLVGFLEYLATFTENHRKSVHPDNVNDIVATVTRAIYGRVCDDAARHFQKQALAGLTREFGRSEANHAAS